MAAVRVDDARGSVDFTGRWRVSYTDASGNPVMLLQDWVQTGSNLMVVDVVSGDTTFTGTLDPLDDHRLALDGTALVCGAFGVCCAADTFSGAADADRGRWDGSFVTHIVAGPGPHCVPMYEAPAIGIRCGDAVRMPEEECDDGNLTDGDGCSSACTIDCAAAPMAGCRLPVASAKASITLKRDALDTNDQLSWKWTNDQLSWKWTKGAITPKSDFGEPPATTSYQLCLYDGAGLLDAIRAPAGGTCGGGPCWRETTTSFEYTDRRSDGMMRIALHEGDAGKARITLKAKGVPLLLPSLAGLASPIRVQLRNPSVCWEAVYSAPFATQSATLLKDRAD